MTPFVGEIDFFAAGRVPRYWMPCNGQLLSISTYQPLFSLIGTTYGGNGTTTFALPNLQGRVPIGPSNAYPLASTGGEEKHTLTPAEIPAHQHALNADGTSAPLGNAVAPSLQTVLGRSADLGTSNPLSVYSTSSPNGTLALQSVSAAGDEAHENRMPFLVIVACIAVTGIYPSRS